MTDVVRVSNLAYEYPGVRALDGVSFTVPRGSVTALVGPNGAGKTTLLRCMAALDQPLDGAIEVDGIDVLEHPRECHRRIGYLSDFFGLYEALSVRQCLAHAAGAQGLAEGEIDGAVRRTAGALNLTEKLDAQAGDLSRGQRQRVAIGQAMIHAPGLLILDEPASGLDPEARHELAALFTRLREGGMTLIVSSHILAELDEYSTHMLVMRAGRIVESRALDGAAAGGALGRVRLRIAFDGAVDAARLRGALGGAEWLDAGDGGGGGGGGGDGGRQVSEALLAVAPEGRAPLLAALVQAGLPVVAFAPDRENLHDSYLKTIKAAGGQS